MKTETCSKKRKQPRSNLNKVDTRYPRGVSREKKTQYTRYKIEYQPKQGPFEHNNNNPFERKITHKREPFSNPLKPRSTTTNGVTIEPPMPPLNNSRTWEWEEENNQAPLFVLGFIVWKTSWVRMNPYVLWYILGRSVCFKLETNKQI